MPQVALIGGRDLAYWNAMKYACLGVVALIGSAACGSVPATPDATDPDAAIAVDGEPPPPARWSAPVLIQSLAGISKDNPSLTADGKEIYFRVYADEMAGVRSQDIWTAKRARVDDPWGAPGPVPGMINTNAHETDPGVSPDGLTLWFASNRAGAGGWDIFVSSRAGRNDPWGAPVAVTELNTMKDDRGPRVTADGKTMTFFSSRPGATGDPDATDIYVATRSAIGEKWSSIVNLGAINTAKTDAGGHLAAGGRAIYFCSNREGDFDLFASTRATPGGDFGAPRRIDELSEGLECGLWVSEDEKQIVFSRSVDRHAELYESTR